MHEVRRDRRHEGAKGRYCAVSVIAPSRHRVIVPSIVAFAVRDLVVRRLGLVPYGEALDLQKSLVEDRRAGRIPDTLLLLEHPHVITLGVKLAEARSHVVATAEALAARGVEVVEDRTRRRCHVPRPGATGGVPDPRSQAGSTRRPSLRARPGGGHDRPVCGLRRGGRPHRRAQRGVGGRSEDRGHRRAHLALDHQPRPGLQRRHPTCRTSTSSCRAASPTRA